MSVNTTRTRPRILIVEDDRGTRTAFVSLLSRLGYDPVPADTVGEALVKLDGHAGHAGHAGASADPAAPAPPAAVILDLNLPDAPGTLVLERIRRNALPVRVAVASGTTDNGLLDEARRLKPDVILPKPMDVRALTEWLDRLE